MRLMSLRNNVSLMKQYAAIWVRAQKEHHPEESKDDMFLEDKCIRITNEKLYDSSHEIFLFEKNGQILGYSELFVEEHCLPVEDLPEVSVKLTDFYIVPDQRRQGNGSGFFKLIRQWARGKGAQLFEATFPKENVSCAEFFKKQGLDLVGLGLEYCFRTFA
jgi:GNAT superfamily N-acetyltransferase